MIKTKFPLIIVAMVLLPILLLSAACSHSSPDIVAGSSLIASVAEDLANNKLEVHNLIPPGMCPGHYDLKPSDIETLANSKALIIHNWQQDKANIIGLIEAAHNPNLTISIIDITDAPMIPEVQAETVTRVAQILSEIDPANSAYYQERADGRVPAVLAKGNEIEGRLQEAEVNRVKVICSGMQAEFISWAGFEVVATYGRPEELSIAEVEQLITQARQAGVALVIDNLQSGEAMASKTMAQDIGAVQVTISNFPGGFEGTETWEKAVDKNVDLLLEALVEWRQ